MKAKYRITMMVCTSAAGYKPPLAIIGKSKRLKCFRHDVIPDQDPPTPYKNQNNAWFDREVTIWWITKVFCPWHQKTHGNVCVLLLLDNFSTHKGLDKNRLPEKIVIIFFPTNVNNRHQLADMGIIAAMKVGYRAHMLSILLELFDETDSYKNAEAELARRPRG